MQKPSSVHWRTTTSQFAVCRRYRSSWMQRRSRRTSRTFIINSQASQLIIVRPCLSSRYAVRITLLGTADDSRRRGNAQSTEGQHQGMDRPVIVVITVHRRRQKSMGDHGRGGVRRSTPKDALASRELVSYSLGYNREWTLRPRTY